MRICTLARQAKSDALTMSVTPVVCERFAPRVKRDFFSCSDNQARDIETHMPIVCLRKARGVIILCLSLTAGCAIPTMQMQTKFNPAEHRLYLRVGNASITGQAFVNQRGGIVTCAGNDVPFVPATTFFREAITELSELRRPRTTEKIHPVFKSMIKRGQCDPQGNFSFRRSQTVHGL